MTRVVKQAAVRKLEIVKTARALFQSRGYENTAIQDVMDALGVAKGTIYYYFKSKDELLEAVINDKVDESAAQMQAVLAAAQGNALQKIGLLMAAGNLAESHAQMLASLHQPGNMGMHTRLMAAALNKQAPLYAELIRQGCAEGLFHTDAPLECAEFILTAVQFLTDEGVYPWTQAELTRRAQAFPGLIEAQLQAAPGSFSFL
jgi:AcrR family transcriptional regulator